MPANKKKTNKKISKDERKGILMKRDRPLHDAEVPFLCRKQMDEIWKFKRKQAGIANPDFLPHLGTWREYNFLTYYSATNKSGEEGQQLMSIVQDLEKSYCKAIRKEDWDGITESALELVQLTAPLGGDKDDGWNYAQYRYDKFVFMDEQFPEFEYSLSDWCEEYLKEMQQNPKELPFLRAVAAHLLARSFYYLPEDDQDEEGQLSLIRLLDERCKAVPDEHRERTIQRYGYDRTVGEVLDMMLGGWDDTRNELEYELETPVQAKEEEQKLKELYRQTNFEDVFPNPPTLSSYTLTLVAQRPVSECCFLVAKQELTFDEKVDLGRGVCQSKERLNRNKERLDKGEKYIVMEVDCRRYLKGKRTRLFRQVQVCLVPKNESLPKKVLTPLAMACLEPYQWFSPGVSPEVPKDHKPSRPKKVLFESDEMKNHPQMKMFLSMMGFTIDMIDVADPTLVQILAEEVMAPNEEEFPYQHDQAMGIKCAECGQAGTGLQQCRCPCKKVHYCSRECQEKHWPSHKASHKQAMRRMKPRKRGERGIAD